MMDCPFCGRKKKDLRRMVSHLLADHEREEIGLERFVLGLGPDDPGGWAYCWCGHLVCEPESWARHLDQCGGMEAHLLECGLGLAP